MDTVGSDYDVGFGTRTVRENDCGLVVILLEANTPVAGIDGLGRKHAYEHGEQVCPMHAVELNLAREFGRPHGRGIGPVEAAELRIDPSGAKTEKLVAEPQPPQDSRAVGLDGDAGSNFGECRGLFVKADIHSAQNESRCRSSTADASTDDRDAKWVLGHGNSSMPGIASYCGALSLALAMTPAHSERSPTRREAISGGASPMGRRPGPEMLRTSSVLGTPITSLSTFSTISF